MKTPVNKLMWNSKSLRLHGRTLWEEIFAGINFREFSGHFMGINFPELGFTEDFAGINFRKLCNQEFPGINFRKSALYKDFLGVNLKFAFGNIFPWP